MRILVANPFGIGDVLFSIPLVRALRQSDPGGFLGYLCNRRTRELVAGWPDLDWTTTFEKDEFRAAWKRSRKEGFLLLRDLVREVRRERFDLFFDLSLGWHYGLAALWAGIPRRIGFDFRRRGRFLTDRLPVSGFDRQPVPEYYLELLRLAGMPAPARVDGSLRLTTEAQEAGRNYCAALSMEEGAEWVGVVPGGGTSWGPNARYKQWPADRFAQVADSVASRHGARILLLGDRAEEAICRQVAERMSSRPRIVAEAPSLPALVGLLSRCHLVIGNDGGTMHLARAVGTPTLSIFGPVDGSVYGPYPPGPNHRVVSKGLACRPCYSSFRFPPCPWDNACLKGLAVDAVLEEADRLLKRGARTLPI